jgi:hypothetical protein
VKIGTCRLCLRENQELQNSHFIAAAIYKVCKDGEKQPIMVGGGTSRHTGGQIADELLCRDCEMRFSTNGEGWTIKHMAGLTGFPIHEVLKQTQPLSSSDKFAVYREVAAIDVSQLVYFALSIFWRASVHRWHEPGTERIIETISLGEYEEPIRQFLVDGGPWPSDTVVLISVWPHANPPLAFHTPVGAQKAGFNDFLFSIPGLTFNLAVGAGIPDNLRRICSFSSPERMIFASTDQAGHVLESYAAKVSKSRPMGALAREFPNHPAKPTGT